MMYLGPQTIRIVIGFRSESGNTCGAARKEKCARGNILRGHLTLHHASSRESAS